MGVLVGVVFSDKKLTKISVPPEIGTSDAMSGLMAWQNEVPAKNGFLKAF